LRTSFYYLWTFIIVSLLFVANFGGWLVKSPIDNIPLETSIGEALSTNRVCFVVRTYEGHSVPLVEATDVHYSLDRLLRSLVALENPDWVALVFDTMPLSPRPFTNLYHLVGTIGDQRIRVVNVTVSSEMAPFATQWNLTFDSAYRITDAAVPLCPHDARWLVATNGDNYYFPTFLNHLESTVDVVGTHFYSRNTFLMPSEASPVFRLQNAEGPLSCVSVPTTPCGVNEMRVYRTDLGANVLNLVRWRKEGRTFTSAIPQVYDPEAACHAICADGFTLEALQRSGWRFKVVPQCLFSHEPNAWSCCTQMKGIFRHVALPRCFRKGR